MVNVPAVGKTAHMDTQGGQSATEPPGRTVVMNRCLLVLLAACLVCSSCTSNPEVSNAVAADTAVSMAGEPADVPTLDAEANPEPPTVPEPTPAAEPTAFAMATLNFFDAFQYATEDPTGTRREVSVTNGFSDFDDADEETSFAVTDVAIGDIDGDGEDEAAVTTVSRLGGDGLWSTVRIFKRPGDLEILEVAMTSVGDRSSGGVIGAYISDGELFVETFASDAGGPLCCPTKAVQRRYKLDGARLVETAPQKVRAWIGSDNDQREIRFLPGTASALTKLYPESRSALYTFEAAAGQRLVVSSPSEGWSGRIVVTDQTTGDAIAQGDRIEIVLPTSAAYEVEIDQSIDDPALLEFAILWPTATISAEKPTPVPPVPGEARWETATSEISYSDSESAVSVVQWPVLTQTTADGDIAEINDAIAAFAQALDDGWATYLAEQDGSPAGESAFELDYSVTLSSPDLFSVDFTFYSYICCSPYPTIGHRSLVVDLEAGRVLTLGEYLNVKRLDELATMVVDSAISEFDMPAASAEYLMDATAFMTWDAVALRPDGIEVATDRGELLGAAFPATVTVFTWDELSGIVWQGVMADALIGRSLSPH